MNDGVFKSQYKFAVGPVCAGILVLVAGLLLAASCMNKGLSGINQHYHLSAWAFVLALSMLWVALPIDAYRRSSRGAGQMAFFVLALSSLVLLDAGLVETFVGQALNPFKFALAPLSASIGPKTMRITWPLLLAAGAFGFCLANLWLTRSNQIRYDAILKEFRDREKKKTK